MSNMMRINKDKRWPMALTIIGIVLVASVVIYFINWEMDSQFSMWGYLFGLPIGIIIGYGWCLLVFSLALRLLGRFSDSWRAIGKPNDERKWFFLFYLALLYVPIGESYAMMIWKGSYYHPTLIPAMSQPWQIAAMIVPIAMLWLVSFALAYAELKWEKKQASVIAVFLSVFTLLWIQPVLPYVMGRVG